jgi:hypothetical protein
MELYAQPSTRLHEAILKQREHFTFMWSEGAVAQLQLFPRHLATGSEESH